MTQWMTSLELAEALELENAQVKDILIGLSLLSGAEPSTLACAHGLGRLPQLDLFAEPGDASQAMWHPDVLVILRGVWDLSRRGSTYSREEVERPPLPEKRLDSPKTSSSSSRLFTEPRNESSTRSFKEDEVATKNRSLRQGTSVGIIQPGFDAIIATDGACHGNPGAGGWAWVEQISGRRSSGGAASTTNNIMELTAVIDALENVDPSARLLLRIDSQYVINTMTKWAKGWRAKGWKKADGSAVKNRELVEKLLHLYESRTGVTKVEWVKGHAGDEANELCDSLATREAQRFA